MEQPHHFTDNVYDKCMEYETLGARTSDTYDNIELQPRTAEVDANVQQDGNTKCIKLSDRRTKKIVCIGIIVAVISLLVVVVAVMVYVFQSSKPQGGSCNTITCEPVDCGLPRDITNSKQLAPEKTTYNNSFSVECNSGYSLNGSERVTCNIDGQWSDLPICDIVSCGIPNIPAHASITNLTGTSFQSTVTIKCDEGYSMHGVSVISCTSSGNWTANPTCGQAADCFDIYNMNIGNTSGVYSVKLWKSKQTIDVYCDMDTYPYGWTVFQKRFNGSVDFYRNFSEYTNGFGNLRGEFWLGLRNMEEMASQYESELRLDITAADNSHVYEVFQNFSLSKYPNFTLHLGTQTVEQISDNTNGFSKCNGYDFSTFDHDADVSSRNCASVQHGGWWYWNCVQTNLNGEYLSPPGARSTYYYGWGGFIYYAWKGLSTLKSSHIMFRKHT